MFVLVIRGKRVVSMFSGINWISLFPAGKTDSKFPMIAQNIGPIGSNLSTFMSSSPFLPNDAVCGGGGGGPVCIFAR